MHRVTAVLLSAFALASCATATAQTATPAPEVQQSQSTLAAAPTPSIMMVRVYTPDLQRAADFYTRAFGLTATPYGGNEIMLTFPSGGTGIVLYRPDAGATPMRSGFVLNVDDVDASLAAVLAAGGAQVRPVFEVPQVHIKGVIVADLDGSSIEMVEHTGQ